MQRDRTGRRPALLAVTRGGLLSVGLLLGAGLSACTTVEGTNAMTDIGTFERDVMTETLKGMGMVDSEVKPEETNRRGPLVLPKQTAVLPTPESEDKEVALLPKDSGTVQIDTTGLTDEDMRRLRNARVVDLRTPDGRPLTAVEQKQLTARMTADIIKNGGTRPLYMPPEKYFTTVKGQDMVCLAANGELVPLNDKACPPEIRAALAKAETRQ
jgi:hypothetical protein